MLTDAQIEQAKRLAVEYVQVNLDIKAIENKLAEHDLKPEIREQQQKALNDRNQRKQEIEKIFEKEYGIDSQKLQDKTPLGIMNHVREQQLKSQNIPSSPDKPQEPGKALPTPTWATNSTKTEAERHGEPNPSSAEPTREDTVLKVTGSTKSQVKDLVDSFREQAQKHREHLAQEQQHEKQQTHRRDRGRDRG